MVDSYIMYQSFYEAIKTLDSESQLSLFHAMSEYAYYEKEPSLTGAAVGMWALIKPLLDSNMSKRVSRQKAGSAGGKQTASKRVANGKQNDSKNVANEQQTCSKPQANVNGNVNVNVNVNGNGKKKTTPTREEVRLYAKQRNSTVDPDKFFDYFESGGWVDAKGNSVRSWKQKFLTWESFQGGKPQSKPKTEQVKSSAFTDDLDMIEKKLYGGGV